MEKTTRSVLIERSDDFPIKKFHKWFLGDYVLELGDPQGIRLKIGRSYLAALRDKFKFRESLHH